MREDNLLCLRTRRFVPATTDSQHGWRVWPNLARGLVTRHLNELWVADITYVRLQEEFVYVAVVLDAHSRRVIGWALAQHLGASVAVQALRMALLERQPAPGLIHHSDRGIQYACADYLTLLADHGVKPSMSPVGNPYDNAKAESFIKTLKQEQVHGREWRDLDALRAELTTFFDIIYNHQRLHSALGYQTPAAFEKQLLCAQNPEASTELTGARGSNRPLAPDPTPRFTIFFARKLSLISLSHVRGALQGAFLFIFTLADENRRAVRLPHATGKREKISQGPPLSLAHPLVRPGKSTRCEKGLRENHKRTRPLRPLR